MYPVLSTVLSISTVSAMMSECCKKRAKKPKKLPLVLEQAKPEQPLDQPPQLKSVSNRIVCYKEMPKKPSPVLEQAKSEQPMDRMPQPNVPPWPFRFGLVYNILTCFDRRELCYLRNIDHRHYTVIERKFGTTPPYLVSNGQRLSKSSWKWWPPLGESIEEMPTDVRDQLPTSKFVRFKSSEMLVYNPNESNIDVLSLSHVWENQTLTLSCAKDFAWNEEWAHVAAKAKHLDVLNGQGSITYLRQLTSDNCVRLSLRDSTDTLDTVELPWDHILEFLLQPNPEDTKIIQINSDNPFNQHQVETLEFIKQAKQKFLDSPDSVHFTFAWESLSNDNPITFDGLDAPNNGPLFDDFIVQNRRTKQRLRFRSTVQEFRLAVEDQ